MKLIFVYNASSGKLNAVLDGLHKMFSPRSYDCQLCAITFGNFSENRLWKKFREESEAEMKFYYKDQFLKQFRSKWLPKYDFPVLLVEKNGRLDVLIGAAELNTLENVNQLILAVKKGQSHY